MVAWIYWLNKKVYIVLKNQKVYEGKIIDVDDSAYPLVWITIVDKYKQRIIFVNSEIELLREEMDKEEWEKIKKKEEEDAKEEKDF